MRVVVLGAGPAGLMACAAVLAVEPSADLVILSRGATRSDLYGAQYLHEPIPGYTPPAFQQIAYKLNGTPDEYRRKVYGPLWDGTVSPEEFLEPHYGWDLRETYQRLWEDFGPHVGNVTIDPAGLNAVQSGQSFYGKVHLVINTIPRPLLCTEGHQFGSTTIIAAGEAMDDKLAIKLPYRCPEFTVLCNGEEHPSYYRLSNIYGHKTVEWPEHVTPPIPTAAKVVKPTKTNCSCSPDVLHVGRYGKWQKGVLTHHAYEEVRKHLAPAEEAATPTG